MSEAVYAARKQSKAQTANSLASIVLKKSANGRVSHVETELAIKQFLRGLGEVAKKPSESPIAAIKSTDHSDRHEIMSDSIEAAEQKTKADKDGKTYAPDLSNLVAAQDEADRRN